MEEKEGISKTLGYEWHYIKKKKKSIQSNIFSP